MRLLLTVARRAPDASTDLLVDLDDTDPDAARETRRAFSARFGDRPVTVLGTHFHHPTAGRIVKHGDTWRFTVEA